MRYKCNGARPSISSATGIRGHCGSRDPWRLSTGLRLGPVNRCAVPTGSEVFGRHPGGPSGPSGLPVRRDLGSDLPEWPGCTCEGRFQGGPTRPGSVSLGQFPRNSGRWLFRRLDHIRLPPLGSFRTRGTRPHSTTGERRYDLSRSVPYSLPPLRELLPARRVILVGLDSAIELSLRLLACDGEFTRSFSVARCAQSSSRTLGNSSDPHQSHKNPSSCYDVSPWRP